MTRCPPGTSTDAERHGHGIEAFIGKRERGAVLPGKGNPVREVRLFYFFTSHIHHAFGYVGPDEHIGLQFAAGKYGKVSGSGRYVHDAPGAERAERVNRLLAPAAVYTHRQGMVQLVVGGGDVVEHLFDLFALLAVVAVRLDVFLGVVHPSIVTLSTPLRSFQYVRRCCLCPL